MPRFTKCLSTIAYARSTGSGRSPKLRTSIHSTDQLEKEAADQTQIQAAIG